ncbi:hypothetical protein N7447_003651 [Penicillium robsamsonii]|uniref:uncharacterized protein n=1 Tax=Penicillium robsamsonii TaxID=1792511 RepID=UPI002547EC65|nr:uncharacterized protein N7447_003651 [Penicillium robsamsonii]KAJ5826888.1 hypothetical protein N7447_003651 [Penicillium robsamsonii]
MKGNVAFYEAIAEIWSANTGRNISHQTVHKHVTDRLKEHAAILAIPEARRARMNATETVIFDYANEIYEMNDGRSSLVQVLSLRQIPTLEQEIKGLETRQILCKKRASNNPGTRPPSPPAESPLLHTEMALFLSMMNSRAVSEALTAAKRSDITRLEHRINSMAATMGGMMGLLRTLVQRQPRLN